jgi:hypothetical protein
LDKPVGQRGLAMIDMGDYAKVANKPCFSHWDTIAIIGKILQRLNVNTLHSFQHKFTGNDPGSFQEPAP